MEEFYPAREGGPLNVGGEVLTGANSEVYLTVSDGAVLRLGPNSIFGLEMGISSEEIVMPRFRLELGEMEVVSGSGGFLIYTPNEVLGAIGSAALVTVSPDGEASMDCISGDCFQYDGTEETEGVKDDLPDAVAAALDVAGAQIENTGKPTDTDSDGVPDELDLCGEEGDQGYGLDVQGCPINEYGANYYDTDGDGFPNAVDHCDYDGDEGYGLDVWGCPKDPTGWSSTDYDADGIRNEWDVCPWEGDQGFGLTPIGCPIYGDGVKDDDTDGDGLGDEFDLCPLEGDQGYGVGPRGCPKNEDGISIHDSDGDGFPDGFDVCPSDRDQGYGLDAWGCSKDETGVSNADYDADGIRNDSDLCPNHGDQGYGLDALGCPIQDNGTNVTSDFDGDGIPDAVDRCSRTGDVHRLGVDVDGCPITPSDSDGDGIPDHLDDCPTEGNLGSGVDPRGCAYELGCTSDSQDFDGDGYVDCVDRCPTIYYPSYESLDGLYHMSTIGEDFETLFSGSEFFGCPPGDFDFDGVPDVLPERCAGEASVGECQDRDGDGFDDSIDECPDEFANQYTSADAWNNVLGTGCPVLDLNHNHIPDYEECEGCIPPGSEEDPSACLDRDGDGVCVEDDQCPAQAGAPENSGCPVSQDWDGDGFNDDIDHCPTIHAPETAAGGNYGCPAGDYDSDGVPDDVQCDSIVDCFDWDGDGVTNDRDECPLTYAYHQPNGCLPGDNDFDGIPDVSECDDCIPPDEAECVDQDQDGICNDKDVCPLVVGNMSNLGCPPLSNDYDNDGWPDEGDFCPTVYSPDFQNHGCPPGDHDFDGVPDEPLGFCLGDTSGVDCQDRDGDGVDDSLDVCPDTWTERLNPSEFEINAVGNIPDLGCPIYREYEHIGEIGVEGIPDILDSDGDGIIDSLDQCPTLSAPGGYDPDNPGYLLAGCPAGDHDFDGVPDPPECTDTDQDGLCDAQDDCPFVAGLMENTGCKEADSDGDGVRDGSDLCPGIVDPLHGVTPLGCPRVFTSRLDGRNTEDVTANTPITGDEITVLAPTFQLPRAIDKDSDGYADRVDQCPTQGDEGYGLDLNGCPLAPPAGDADQDGFADDHDNCPNEGDQGYGLGRTGCPLPPPADSDGDGIIDAEDACPALGDQGAGLRDNGCPVSGKATADPDGDGIVGSLDKCPEQGGDVGLDGCPKQAGDSDGDGVADDRDSCPDVGNLGYGISRDGCPLKPPDTDGDGVVDNEDSCPNKGDLGYGITADGCPASAPDSDGDGLNDSVDKCPDKGDHGFGVDKSGCPLSNPNPPTPIPAADSDGDGFDDRVDQCPNEGDQGYGLNARGCPNPPPEPTAAPPEPTDAPPEPTADPT